MAKKGENIYKRKDGRYEGRYVKYYDTNNKPKWGYVYGRTYAETKEKLAIKRVESKNEKPLLSSDMTLNQWLDRWIETQRMIEPSTKMMYYSLHKNHIQNTIGTIMLKRISEEVIQNFIDDESRKYAPKTVHSVFSMLRLALKDANNKRYISNVYSSTRLPKLKKPVFHVLSKPEQRRLEKIILASENRYDIGILVCLYTGLRIGELCALTWDDIDLRNATITVTKTAKRVLNDDKNSTAKTKVELGGPKSIASERIIPIPRFLVKLLYKYHRETGYILRDDGKYTDTRNINRRFKKLLQLAEIPDTKFHITRHTFATRALELGMDVKTLSEILGHASVNITLNLYAHSLPEHKRKEMEKFDKLFRNQSE